MHRPIEVFFSYAREDEALMDDVRRQLVLFDRQGLIRKWHDRAIPPGAEWRNELAHRLAASDIILLLVSPHFFASDFCYETELPEAMRRHHLGTARVIPVIVRPCAWTSAPFATLQVLPLDAQPVTMWPNRDQACLDVAEGVMQIVQQLRSEPTPPESWPRAFSKNERVLAVRVHRAFFIDETEECHFINLTNLSARRVLEVTHVWYEDEARYIPIEQSSRPLPVRLDLDQSWETWIKSSALPSSHRLDALSRFRARTSDGTVFASRANTSVQPIGVVPGGPIDVTS